MTGIEMSVIEQFGPANGIFFCPVLEDIISYLAKRMIYFYRLISFA
jgi:hypothetical protein